MNVMRDQRSNLARVAGCCLALSLFGCSIVAGPAPWTHAQPDRSLTEDSTACNASARTLALEQRGGTSLTLEEEQAFAVTLRRHQQACMQGNGWTRSRDTAQS